MFYNCLLAEIRPENKLFSIFCPFPWLMVQGGWLHHPYAALQAKGSWEDAVPQTGWGRGEAPAALGGSLALLPARKTYFSWEIGGQEG